MDGWNRQPGDVVLLRPSPAATQRTRNRIREHRGSFRLVRGPEPLACLGGRPSVLLQPMGSKGPKEGWWGWLPLEEIELVEMSPPPNEGGVQW
jgi:hypothetical protein